MKKINLTQGKIALVDDCDYETLNKVKWCACKYRKTFYAIRKKNRTKTTIYMHRIILNLTDKKKTDHINGNGLDNRRKNLRICTDSQNKCNRGKTTQNTTGFKGVTYKRTLRKYVAQIRFENKLYYLGVFPSAIDAAKAYNDKAEELHGDFSHK